MNATNEGKPYRVEVTVRAPYDAVWQALTEPAAIRQWFGWDYDGLDAEIEEIFVDGAEPRQPDRIEFVSGDTIELESGSDGAGSYVVVRVVKPGPLDAAEWSDIYDGMEEGWRTFFEQLRFRLERHSTGQRRTVFLTGNARTPDVLTALRPLAKESWHESGYQRMLVDRAGRLVGFAAQRPLAAGAEPGPVSLVVTTYGLGEPAFAEARDEWTAWWRSLVQDAEVTT